MALAIRQKDSPAWLAQALGKKSAAGDRSALNELSGDDRLPLQVAFESGRLDWALELARLGARADLKGSSGETPIAMALRVKGYRLNIIRAMLGLDERGEAPQEGWVSAAANQRSGSERLPLQVAIEERRVDYALALLSAGANPNLTASNGERLMALAGRLLPDAALPMEQASLGYKTKKPSKRVDISQSQPEPEAKQKASAPLAMTVKPSEASMGPSWPLGIKRRFRR